MWVEAGVPVWGTVPERVSIAAGPDGWLSAEGLDAYREVWRELRRTRPRPSNRSRGRRGGTVDAMDVGPVELLIVLAVVLLLFGSKKLPELAKGMGQAAKEFRSGLHDEADEKPRHAGRRRRRRPRRRRTPVLIRQRMRRHARLTRPSR